MYLISICDDDTDFIADFVPMLRQALDRRDTSYELALFTSTQDLLDAAVAGRRFDLVFMDVIFSGTEQGIQCAQTLREQEHSPDLIFMSTAAAFAADSFDVEPLHYLLKPVDPAKLDTALERFLNRNEPQRLRLSTQRGIVMIHLADVIYFEIYSHDIVIHLSGGGQETCAGTLKQLEERLPAGQFIRTHRSYLVNLDHVTEISHYQMVLSNGAKVPVSRSIYRQVQTSFIEYAARRSLVF